MTLFGDMDVSAIREKPPGRQPIRTRRMGIERLDEVLDALERSLLSGARVYWVCPLVSESEVVDLVAAEERFTALQARFGARVRLVHGQMKPPSATRRWRPSRGARATVLVATTVIEVGIDVPEASIIVIEHAERFGLAQLHQLRGRVAAARPSRAACCSTRGRSERPPRAASTFCARRRTAS